MVLYELSINDSNHIYKIADSEFPVEPNLESLSKIVKYKDKYLCFIELDEPEMSVNDIKQVTGYSGNPTVETDNTPKWFFHRMRNGLHVLILWNYGIFIRICRRLSSTDGSHIS